MSDCSANWKHVTFFSNKCTNAVEVALPLKYFFMYAVLSILSASHMFCMVLGNLRFMGGFYVG